MMTEQDIADEVQFRIAERLAILIQGDRPATAEEQAIARSEAEQWEKEYREQHQS